MQSTDIEELLPEAELARLRAELGQDGETPMATDVIEQVCSGMWGNVCDHVWAGPPWPNERVMFAHTSSGTTPHTLLLC